MSNPNRMKNNLMGNNLKRRIIWTDPLSLISWFALFSPFPLRMCKHVCARWTVEKRGRFCMLNFVGKRWQYSNAFKWVNYSVLNTGNGWTQPLPDIWRLGVLFACCFDASQASEVAVEERKRERLLGFFSVAQNVRKTSFSKIFNALLPRTFDRGNRN